MAPKPPPKPRPYSNFLTPALHRHFVHASLLSLCACHAVSCCLARDTSVFWTIFPLSLTGIRSLLIFLCSLVVFLIRISGLEVGSDTNPSSFQSFRRGAFTVTPYVTAVTYLFSAWLFAEICIWSAPETEQLHSVEYGGPMGRSYLNERPIFFRSLFTTLAVVQAAHHLMWSVNTVTLPLKMTGVRPRATILSVIRSQPALQLLFPIVTKAVFACVLGTFGYLWIYRALLWSFWTQIFSPLYSFPNVSYPRVAVPTGFFDITVKFLIDASLLSFIWEFTNKVFSVFITEQPLKKDRPLTDDSKDPNGSLLSGLRGKRPFSRSMAFWELAMISSDFESRRVTIFQQLDRSGGATWTQILTICLAELQGIQDRIKDFHIRSQPPPAAAKPSDPAPTADATPAPDVRKPSAASVYPQPPPPTLRQLVRHRVSEMVIEHGSQPGAASPAAQLLAASAQGAATLLLTDAQREALAPGALRDRAAAAGTAVLATQVAAPLRKPWARRVAGVVCGAPRARGAVIAAAAGALAGLVVRSLKEDGAGRVQRDIPNIARTLAATLTAVEAFLATCPPHWSDVTFRGTAAERAGPEEVRAVVAALRGGLAEIVGAFGEYFDAMDVKADEARAWKKMVASKPAEKGPARPRTPEMRRAKN